MPRNFRHAWPFARDVLLFAIGAVGVLHETLIAKGERPNLLILFGALLGLPLFTRDGPKK
jgi:hypothetical protein